MSYDDLKRRKGQSSEVVNPYVKNKQKTIDKEDNTGFDELSLTIEAKEKVVMANSLLTGQNKYLFSEVKNLEREIKELKEDIASLFCMFANEKPSPLTDVEAREKYLLFKENKNHLLNRKINPF